MSKATAAAPFRSRPSLLLLALLLALPGCAHQARPDNWRAIISRRDVDRMREWRKGWVEALAKARQEGNAAAIDAAGPLLDPDAGLDSPLPQLGDYHCRVITLGEGRGVRGGFTAEPPGQCRVNEVGNGILGFSRLDGPQRPIGRIYPGPGAQLTFLGALAVGDEARPFDYGVDEQRSLAGLVERVGPHRWRLVLPRPPFGGAFAVIELVPGSD